MRTKKLRKFCSLITAIIICITCIVNISGCKVEDLFKEKMYIEPEILDYIKGKADELDTEEIIVDIYYEETYSTTLEKGTDEYIQDMFAYYGSLNQQRLDALGLKDYKSVYPSKMIPCISLLYLSYNAWIKSEDYDKIKLAAVDSNDLICVEVSRNVKPVPSAEVGDFYYTYERYSEDSNSNDFSIYKDLGIPKSGNLFKGDNIKVGILEMGIPSNWSNIGDTYKRVMLPSNYDTSDLSDEDKEYYENHAYYVYSILGGSSGIASEADLYFSAFLDKHTFNTAVELLIGAGVDIINISISIYAGGYKNISKYLDSVIENSNVIMVMCAGNGDSNVLTNSLSTAINGFSVGSTNFDLRLSEFSTTSLGDIGSSYELIKPTISAPGANIGTFGGLSEFYGTSFSTPIVTGIIAMLMDEFPVLVDHPELVMPLLTNTATKATGQTDIVDEDVGYGIVNYARARQYINNLDDFIMTEAYTGHNDTVYETSVYVPSGSKLRVTAFVLNNVDDYEYNTSNIFNSAIPSFTPIYVTLQNQHTFEISAGDSISNLSTVELVNTSGIRALFKICVYTDINKTSSEYERCGIHYLIESANQPHEERYTYRLEQMSGNHSLHRWYCSCGNSITEPHTWETVGIHEAIRCKWCGFETNIMLNGGDKDEVYEK